MKNRNQTIQSDADLILWLFCLLSYANGTNFGFGKLHRDSRHPQFSYFSHYVSQSKKLDN